MHSDVELVPVCLGVLEHLVLGLEDHRAGGCLEKLGDELTGEMSGGGLHLSVTG